MWYFFIGPQSEMTYIIMLGISFIRVGRTPFLIYEILDSIKLVTASKHVSKPAS